MTVDHIVSRSRRPDLALDPRNLQTLCGTCHGSAKQHHEKSAGDVLAGGSKPSGWPDDPAHPWNLTGGADPRARLAPLPQKPPDRAPRRDFRAFRRN
jgi:hypothetical protein